MDISIRKNYLLNVLYETLKILIPFITTPYISRVLDADGVGSYSFAYSVITYFILFGALGTQSYGTREIARSRNERRLYSKLFWEIEIMTILTSGICFIAWALVTMFGGGYKYYYLALSPFLLGTMFDISWFFIGLEKIKELVTVNSVVKIAGAILLFAFVKRKEDILIYCLINSLSLLIGNLSLWIFVPQLVCRIDCKDLKIKTHLCETIIYFIPTIATSIYTVLDKTLIGVLTKNPYQNGYYEQATKIINIVKSCSFVALNTVMTARISYLFSENKHSEIKKRITESMNFILLICTGASFGIIGISFRFVPVFFGSGYEPVVKLLCYMVPLILIIGISSCLGGQYYTPSGKRAQSARYIVIGAFVNLTLNVCLIPLLFAEGAVIASIISELVITCLYITNCEGYISVRELAGMMWKRVIAGAAMAIVVYLLGLIKINGLMIVILQLISGILIYSVLLRALNDEMMKKMTKNKIWKL